MPWRSTSIRPCDARVAGPDMAHFRRPVAADMTPGQAQQRALRNAHQFAQRVAKHVAMVANVGDANDERGWCSHVLQHFPAAPSTPQGCLLSNAAKVTAATAVASKLHACMHAKSTAEMCRVGCIGHCIGRKGMLDTWSNSLELGTAPRLALGQRRDSERQHACCILHMYEASPSLKLSLGKKRINKMTQPAGGTSPHGKNGTDGDDGHDDRQPWSHHAAPSGRLDPASRIVTRSPRSSSLPEEGWG
jgi:hypothetical protein